MRWNPFRRRRPQRSRRGGENFLLVTYDSCRFDAYEAARTPVLDAHSKARKAWSQATYTYPSHMSMFQGMLPHVFTEEEYYNRFVRQLWRRTHRKVGGPPRVHLPGSTQNIIHGFRELGYYTCGAAAMAWFRGNSLLRMHWEDFEWTGIHAARQVQWTQEQLSAHRDQPFFAFINFGETHAPYRTDQEVLGTEGAVASRPKNRKTVWLEEGWELDDELWGRQRECAEFLDARMGDLLRFFRDEGRDVTVVMCGDHGDCLGDNGLWGHGFYHPKVMEVPMAIFDYRADGTSSEPGLPGPRRRSGEPAADTGDDDDG